MSEAETCSETEEEDEEEEEEEAMSIGMSKDRVIVS